VFSVQYLADVLEARQIVVGTGPRVEMHDLKIRQYYRAILVHFLVELNSPVWLTRKSIVQAIIRPLAFYRTNDANNNPICYILLRLVLCRPIYVFCCISFGQCSVPL